MSKRENEHVLMRYLRDTAVWTAAICAAAGAACIIALLIGSDPRSYVLSAAETAATIGVVSLLISVLVAFFLARWRSGINVASAGLPDKRGDWEACLRKRREVLDARLDIDEPRLCSQHMIRCTCWSFCTTSKCKSGVGERIQPAALRLIRVRELLPEAQGLPVVHRSGIDNCPFRFASPLARLVPLDGVTKNSA